MALIGKPQADPTLEWFLSHCHIHKYPAKSTLIHAGEKADTLYYIVRGTVAVLIKDDEGKEVPALRKANSVTYATAILNTAARLYRIAHEYRGIEGEDKGWEPRQACVAVGGCHL